MSDKVPDGQYQGDLLARRQVAGLTLAETRYRPDFVIPSHAHATPLVFGVIRGSLTEERGRRSVACGSGSLVYQPPDEPHAHRFHEAGAHSFILQFGAPWVERMEGFGILEPSSPLDLRRSRANWLFDRIHDEFRSPDTAAGLAIEGFSLALVSELGRASSRTREGARPAWLMRAVEILHATTDREVHMADIASTVDVHPGHLSRTFRRFYGCTMGDYLRRLRVERARDALLGTHRSIASIALDAGFADQAHFTRVFKRQTGETPAAYRASRSSR